MIDDNKGKQQQQAEPKDTKPSGHPVFSTLALVGYSAMLPAHWALEGSRDNVLPLMFVGLSFLTAPFANILNGVDSYKMINDENRSGLAKNFARAAMAVSVAGPLSMVAGGAGTQMFAGNDAIMPVLTFFMVLGATCSAIAGGALNVTASALPEKSHAPSP